MRSVANFASEARGLFEQAKSAGGAEFLITNPGEIVT
jgi:hypothetical protein